MAITSMAMSLSAIVIIFCGTGCFFFLGALGLPVAITGAVLGHVGLRQCRERGENGRGMALTGVIVGWIAAVIGVLVVVAGILYFTHAF